MHSRTLVALTGALFITLSGCTAARTSPDPELDASVAVGVPEAIRFQTQRGPLDVTPTGAAGTLTFPEVVRLALETSPGIQAALSRVRIAQAEAEQARLLPNPVVNVALRFPEGGGKPVIETGLAAELIALLRRPGLTRAADNRLRAASAEAVKTVLDTVAEAQERYIAVQAVDAELAVLAERREFVNRLLDLARARLDAGEATRLDVLTVESQRVELETELAEKELQRREQRLSLSRLIGQPSGEATWKVEPWQPWPRAGLAESLWVETALKNRPEVQAQRFELAALGADLSAARLAPLADSGLGVDAERDGEWSVGPAVSLPIPIFDTGAAQRDRARASIIEARHRLTETERQIIEEARRAYATLSASNDNLRRIRTELIPVQERRREQAEAQYRGGEADVTSLLIAEQELRAARARLIEVEQRAATSLIRLERAAGGAGVAASLHGPTTSPTTQSTKKD